MSPLDLRVYVVTDRTMGKPEEFWERLEAVLDSGATCLQIREKTSARELYETARRALPLARARRIPLIVNDRLDVAMALDADGVHLGPDDLDAAAARRLWGPHKWIGVSASTPERIRQAEREGADYLGIGAVFATTTKSGTNSVPPDRLAMWTASTSLPVVGIGGIGLDNAWQVFEAGAKGVAVVSAIWNSSAPGDVVLRLRTVAEEFSR